MRVVVQRVRRAAVDVEGRRIAEIEHGLLLLVGIAPEDGTIDLARLARKITTLRVFEDEEGKMNRSVLDSGGEILAVSQFTLYGDTRKGRRPSFVGAAPPDVAQPLFDKLVTAIEEEGVPIQTGRFGAKMAVELVNSGPVTLILEVEPPPS
ncbi:MAG: D-aminoacyl-tRNA deacylase [Candidatus Bipolaricaulia bacterium]